MKSSPALSVVIPTLGREEVLVETIKQVLKDQFKDLELLVIDQTLHHKPATEASLAKIRDSRLRHYRVSPPSGVAAKNFALHHARAKIVLFLDDDIILDKACITTHVEAYKKYPQIMGVAGRVNQDGHEQTDTLLHFDRYALSHGRFNYQKRRPTDTMPGGNMSVYRDAAIEVGGFSTNFLRSQHREESEFCARYYRSYPHLVFEPKAAILHLEAPYGGTRIKTDFADNLDFYKNNLYFMLRYCKLWNIPMATLKQLRLYALRKDPVVTIRRVWLFFVGYLTAIKRLFLPIRIVSKEVQPSGLVRE